MTRDEFLKLTGDVVFHVTRVTNLPCIARRGLMRPAQVARGVGLNPADLALRADPETIVTEDGPVTLNHQRPLLAGQNHDFLTGGTLRDWAMQLDERIFFWPRRMPQAFLDSLSTQADIVLLRLDTGLLFDACRDDIDLCPINSGAALRRPATRGLWIYAPATGTVDRFRGNRIRRALRKTPDSVKEVSLRCDLPLETLNTLLLDPKVLT